MMMKTTRSETPLSRQPHQHPQRTLWIKHSKLQTSMPTLSPLKNSHQFQFQLQLQLQLQLRLQLQLQLQLQPQQPQLNPQHQLLPQR